MNRSSLALLLYILCQSISAAANSVSSRMCSSASLYSLKLVRVVSSYPKEQITDKANTINRPIVGISLDGYCWIPNWLSDHSFTLRVSSPVFALSLSSLTRSHKSYTWVIATVNRKNRDYISNVDCEHVVFPAALFLRFRRLSHSLPSWSSHEALQSLDDSFHLTKRTRILHTCICRAFLSRLMKQWSSSSLTSTRTLVEHVLLWRSDFKQFRVNECHRFIVHLAHSVCVNNVSQEGREEKEWTPIFRWQSISGELNRKH